MLSRRIRLSRPLILLGASALLINCGGAEEVVENERETEAFWGGLGRGLPWTAKSFGDGAPAESSDGTGGGGGGGHSGNGDNNLDGTDVAGNAGEDADPNADLSSGWDPPGNDGSTVAGTQTTAGGGSETAGAGGDPDPTPGHDRGPTGDIGTIGSNHDRGPTGDVGTIGGGGSGCDGSCSGPQYGGDSNPTPASCSITVSSHRASSVKVTWSMRNARDAQSCRWWRIGDSNRGSTSLPCSTSNVSNTWTAANTGAGSHVMYIGVTGRDGVERYCNSGWFTIEEPRPAPRINYFYKSNSYLYWSASNADYCEWSLNGIDQGRIGCSGNYDWSSVRGQQSVRFSACQNSPRRCVSENRSFLFPWF